MMKPTDKPDWIRIGKVPALLGMDRNRFNKEVRPFLTEIPIGKQGIAIERVELEKWEQEYIQRNGRPGLRRDPTWDEEERQDSSSGVGSGTSAKASAGDLAYAKAREQVIKMRRNGT